jgi:hypothetical protein
VGVEGDAGPECPGIPSLRAPRHICDPPNQRRILGDVTVVSSEASASPIRTPLPPTAARPFHRWSESLSPRTTRRHLPDFRKPGTPLEPTTSFVDCSRHLPGSPVRSGGIDRWVCQPFETSLGVQLTSLNYPLKQRGFHGVWLSGRVPRGRRPHRCRHATVPRNRHFVRLTRRT